jgi:hypothetical protein
MWGRQFAGKAAGSWLLEADVDVASPPGLAAPQAVLLLRAWHEHFADPRHNGAGNSRQR